MTLFLKRLFNLLSLLIEGIESLHDFSVFEWVLLSEIVSYLVFLDKSQLALNLIRVNYSRQVSHSHNIPIEYIPSLFNSLCSIVSKNVVQLFEGISGPNQEPTQVTPWSKLQKVKTVNVAGVYAWEISSSSLHEVVFISIDNERSLSNDVPAIPHLSMSRSHLP